MKSDAIKIYTVWRFLGPLKCPKCLLITCNFLYVHLFIVPLCLYDGIILITYSPVCCLHAVFLCTAAAVLRWWTSSSSPYAWHEALQNTTHNSRFGFPHFLPKFKPLEKSHFFFSEMFSNKNYYFRILLRKQWVIAEKRRHAKQAKRKCRRLTVSRSYVYVRSLQSLPFNQSEQGNFLTHIYPFLIR